MLVRLGNSRHRLAISALLALHRLYPYRLIRSGLLIFSIHCLLYRISTALLWPYRLDIALNGSLLPYLPYSRIALPLVRQLRAYIGVYHIIRNH